jgi:hypothetical protein
MFASARIRTLSSSYTIESSCRVSYSVCAPGNHQSQKEEDNQVDEEYQCVTELIEERGYDRDDASGGS